MSSWPEISAERIGKSGQWIDINGDNLLFSVVEFNFPVDKSRGFCLGVNHNVTSNKIDEKSIDTINQRIGRLYMAAFCRKSDEGGLQYWVNEVSYHLVSYKDVS